MTAADNKKNRYLYFILILIMAAILRFNGLNWDQGHSLHPDERMLTFVTERINFFSNLNPDFFAYGTLPVYLVKGAAQLISRFFHHPITAFHDVVFLGRVISSILDMGTCILAGILAHLIFNRRFVTFGSLFFYSIMFFPIQNSHFYIVDNYLNFLVSLLLLLILFRLRNPSPLNTAGMAVTMAALLASKITPVILLPIFIGLFFIRWFDGRLQFALGLKSWVNLVVFIALLLLFHFLFMPYAYINFSQFYLETLAQMTMGRDPYVFPYTLQYVDTPAYVYPLKNIFWWGAGPVISVLGLIGLFCLIFRLIRQLRQPKDLAFYLILTYLLINIYYFAVLGQSAVKFMRYMLPLYPFIAVMAGVGLEKISSAVKYPVIKYGVLGLTVLLTVLWTTAFISIYAQDHTRVQATRWINNHIPEGATLAVEHWDDRLPLDQVEKYNYVELNLYDIPDDEQKWAGLSEKLAQAEYIILASNKLYVPLQSLSDCARYKSCYPKTSQYYKDLFAGKLGFEKTAEFTAYPKLTLLSNNFILNDDRADESFTVYDHPKVIIFQKK